MKNSTKSLLFCAGAAIAGMYAYNKFVATTSTRKNILSVKYGQFYEWTHGNIYYTKSGSGSPVLLIHDTAPSSSGYEWNRIVNRLEKNHTVYTIDLIGCGRSDKPGINYTNFLYVQLLNNFIDDVIKEKTDVVASNLSASFVIMATQMRKDLINKIVFINPATIKELKKIPDNKDRALRDIINLPVIGTFIYNIRHNPIRIDMNFRNSYFSKGQLISNKMEDAYYESAHIDEGNGKFLFSSILSSFFNADITRALKNMDNPIYIIGSKEIKKNLTELEQYHKLNKNVEITMISNANLYPQLEIPEKLALLINNYLD